ncbi:FAD-binding oxidoreductase [Herbiconiux sp. YIM B11900]|uniref:FAD-binding oxidoreductase n=1 Tax=Herbiconiux sp. YIM B11900 TaxID=3404131 RepID=UPI003F84416D
MSSPLATVETTRIDALIQELREGTGPEAIDPATISTDEAARRKASVDEAAMSPLLAAQLPLGLADVVITPTRVEEVPVIVSAAVRHGIPLTTRGRGTGNYGQGIPLHGGIVLDLRRLTAVVAVQEGSITAEAGARLLDLDKAARREGQELTVIPSTVQSSLGGFLAGGSAGAGTIAYGNTRQGFVLALDVVHAVEDARIVRVEGADAVPYLHSFGVLGVIVRATVRLHPEPAWVAVYARFDTLAAAGSAFRGLGTLHPAPKLVSADDAVIADALPRDEALPAGVVSLRTIVDASVLEAAERIVAEHGGSVVVAKPGAADALKMSMLAYNHPAWWFLRSHTGEYFHLEVFGDVVIDDPERIRALFPEAHLHLEYGHSVHFGALVLPYRAPGDIAAAIQTLTAAGIGSHDCHSWVIDSRPDELRRLARDTDPAGILNPGKFPEQPGVAA